MQHRKQKPFEKFLVNGSFSGTVGLFIVIVLVFVAIFADELSPHDYAKQSIPNALLPPMWIDGGKSEYILGTDQLGRDILSRILHGARVSLLVCVGAIVFSGVLGTFLGIVAGYKGGKIDNIIMRLADIQLSFSPIFLCIAIMAVIGQGLDKVIIVLGITSWVAYARVARASTLSIKHEIYVEAAMSMGASDWDILFHHILPNIRRPLLVIVVMNAGTQILNEASLSFLGLGVQPPTPTWGNMLSEAQGYFRIDWWFPLFPGIMIFLTVIGINLLSKALQRKS